MKKVIIIGAGVSGLAAGIYARQSGLDVTIYEKHFKTGGVCTSWSRKGYTFEGAVHWLTDSSKELPFYKVWTETGILNDQIEVYRKDPYTTLEYKNDIIKLYRDVDKLRAELMRIAVEDKKAINTLCSDIQSFYNMSMPITDVKGVKVKYKSKFSLGQSLGMLRAFPRLGKIMGQTVSEYLAMFTNDGIKAVLTDLMPEGYCALALISTMVTFSNSGYFPKGGALGLVERMTKTFTDLGGKICLSTPVDKVLVEDKRARGIIINGEKIEADAVIVTRDILTADDLFDHPPVDEWINSIKAATIPQTCIFLGIGVKADLSDLPYQFHFYTNKPYLVAGREHVRFGFTNYSGMEEYSPKGSSALTVCFLNDSYDFWKNARQENRYTEEKNALAKTITEILEEKFPRIRDNIEIIDIATPLTYERYTGSYRGSWMSIMPPNHKISFGEEKGCCKDISGLYFAGFRTQAPGGLPVALNSGRAAALFVCRQLDMVFQGDI